MSHLEIVQNAFRNPVFIAAVSGIVFGAAGIVKMIINTELGTLYLSMKNSITVILNSLILIAVGYDFEFDLSRVKIACRAIAARVVIQGMLLIPVMGLIRWLYPENVFMVGAAMIYMFAPPSFGMQSYLKSEEAGKFIAATNSLYMIVTLAIYSISSALFIN